jgi:hypothetical protein
MGEIKVKVKEKTERMFREAAMHEFGFQKGSYSLAAEQALGNWARKHQDLDRLRRMAREEIKDPVKSIRGILKHVKMGSVELKHEASKIRAERWRKHAH